MKLAILAFGNGWHVRDLQRAAAAAGHEAAFLDFRKVSGGVAVTHGPLRQFDAVIVRTMPPGSLEQVVFRMDLLHRLRAEGVPVFNSPAALEASIDKYATTARLHAAGLPTPATIVCQDADTALEAFHLLGGDVVVKPLFGSEGRGIVRVNDSEIAWRTFRTLERLQTVLYLQKFVDNPGWDLRAFVLGGRVLTAMRRHANNDWRTNVAQGGRSEPVQLSPQQETLALRAAAALQVDMAGIDLLPDRSGQFYVLEVNAVPGWRALSKTTNVDVAAEAISHVARSLRQTSQGGVRASPAQLACIWEATARKPGNVHRLRDFADLTYVDFLASGAAIAPILDQACGQSVGRTVLDAIRATRQVATTNSNLGIVLLLAPLAAVPVGCDLRTGVADVLAALDVDDSRDVFEAIRLAQPGGLGKSDAQDVFAAPTLPLRDIMAIAAERDFIARQYANGFRDVFDVGVPAFTAAWSQLHDLEQAIIITHLRLLAVFPDSLIVRKHGLAAAEQTSRHAAQVLDAGWPEADTSRQALNDFDFWLQAAKLNPGTTADLVAACLFVALRERIIMPPVRWSSISHTNTPADKPGA